jgi:hypothetical protein
MENDPVTVKIQCGVGRQGTQQYRRKRVFRTPPGRNNICTTRCSGQKKAAYGNEGKNRKNNSVHVMANINKGCQTSVDSLQAIHNN